MSPHPAFSPGRAAVITGAAGGIGLAAAGKLAEIGMKVCMADSNAGALQAAAHDVSRRARAPSDVIAIPTDVARREEIERLRERAYAAFGDVALLMNNAGRSGDGGLFSPPAGWTAMMDANFWGVVHGVQVFAPAMIAGGKAGAIVNTGSKQGITCPPGNTAYNVTKAAVKVVTEALAHELRNIEGCRITAHLLVPGFTFTGMTSASGAEKPAAAWTPAEVVDFMVARMAEGDFYILCPDNEVTREIDAKRILWAADDVAANRPALSRWHPDFKEAFAAYMRA